MTSSGAADRVAHGQDQRGVAEDDRRAAVPVQVGEAVERGPAPERRTGVVLPLLEDDDTHPDAGECPGSHGSAGARADNDGVGT